MRKCLDSGAPLLTLVVGDRVRSSVKGVDQRRCLSYMSPQHGGSQDPMQIVHLPGFMNSPVAGSPDPAPHLASVSTACSKGLCSSICSLFRINGIHSSVLLGRVFLSRIQSQPQKHKTKPELFAFTQVPSRCTHRPDLHFQSHHAPDIAGRALLPVRATLRNVSLCPEVPLLCALSSSPILQSSA